jgi:hypothetical protein
LGKGFEPPEAECDIVKVVTAPKSYLKKKRDNHREGASLLYLDISHARSIPKERRAVKPYAPPSMSTCTAITTVAPLLRYRRCRSGATMVVEGTSLAAK